MVVRKRLDYGSRGHQVPAMPRVPSSARGKRSTRRKKDETCAFDLLAAVAGSLLVDQENSSGVPVDIGTSASTCSRKRKPVKAEQRDDVLPLKTVALENCIVGSGGTTSASPRQTNICSAENSSTRNETDSVLLESLTEEPNVLFSCTKPCNCGIPECGAHGVCHPGSALSLEANQVDVDARPPALVSSDSSSGMPLCRAEVQHAANRDDDENSSGCTHPCTAGNKGYVPHYIGDNRIRKLFASRLRKVARNKMCGEMSNKGSKQNFRGKKISATRQKVQRAMFKRKKAVRRHFTPSSAKGILNEVKLRIKSFTIPELLIEIPENATIGSLKRTVMDVVTSIIEGGLRVGVHLEGKNIQDDNKTLRQARICHGENLDNVDFTLECEAGQYSSPGVRVPEDMGFLGADAMKPLAMIKCEEPFSETKASDNSQHSLVETASSQAIVPVASPNSDALAIVPVCKSRRAATMGQRRIRRPFSLPEVEALVDAVEQLGTGRWRDVKRLAFDNTDHRTYVDLKDKWKTLVHTASISPHQRRGQPVPQGLLDRVLLAQAYWSHQQLLSGKASGQGSSSC